MPMNKRDYTKTASRKTARSNATGKSPFRSSLKSGGKPKGVSAKDAKAKMKSLGYEYSKVASEPESVGPKPKVRRR